MKPEIDGQTANKLDQHKRSQKQRYDRRSQPLSPLVSGQAIRMKLPGNNEWSLGRCITTLPNRSYEVEVAGRRFRRNRRQLRTTAEKSPPQTTAEIGTPGEITDNAELSETHLQDPSVPHVSEDVLPPEHMEPRRSSRVTKPPIWHKDYTLN